MSLLIDFSILSNLYAIYMYSIYIYNIYYTSFCEMQIIPLYCINKHFIITRYILAIKIPLEIVYIIKYI